jgi:hypothetical protein
MADNNNCDCQIDVTYYRECGKNETCRIVEVGACDNATRLRSDDIIRDPNTPYRNVGDVEDGYLERPDDVVIPCKNAQVNKTRLQGNCG